jgi:arylsulfatase A-like enzyme
MMMKPMAMQARRLLRRASRAAIAAAMVCCPLPTAASAETGKAAQPNVVLILADDLGFSDLGSFGGEIATPNLDRLAAEGTRLTNFHATAACSPTRAQLLTGVDHHRTGFGTFAEMMRDNQRGQPGYEGQLSRDLPTLAQRLKDAGYFTAMSGKWHLGTAPWADPSARGFDRSFALIGGGANHFGRAQGGAAQFGETYTQQGQRLETLPDDFYSTDHFTSQMTGFLDEVPAGRPFFAYLAFTAPHYPLQAPAADIARYLGRYDGGWAALYRARFDAVRRLGLVPNARFDKPLHDRLQREWDALAPQDRAVSARKMEVYAAMVDRMDRNIGLLIDRLKAAGRYDNTIFLFMSDNGPEGTELENSRHHSTVGRAILAGSDNRLDALGSARSYAWYGPGWAHAAAAPFAMFKQYPYEGGIRVPAILRLPGTARPTHARPTYGKYVSVLAVADTLMAWTGQRSAGRPPRISALAEATPAGIGWELWGRRGYRQGRWMAVLVPDEDGADHWRLYDMRRDPSQSVDAGPKHPQVLAGMVAKWNAYAKRNGIVLPDITGL